jgi:cytochrome P450
MNTQLTDLLQGSDTTSSTMSAVLFYLLHNPAWLAAASAEVRAAFDSEDEIVVGPILSSCEVLAACSTESMRLTPTAPNGPPRVVDEGGITVDGNFLQQGTTVSSPIYHLQRDENIFDSPHGFKPDRWIVDEDRGYSKERVEGQQKAYFPFHVGPRSCELLFVGIRSRFLVHQRKDC